MRAGLIALLVVAFAAGACSKKSSLYLDPGERSPSAKAVTPPTLTPSAPPGVQPAKASQPPKP